MLKNKLIVLAFAGIILAGTIIGSASAARFGGTIYTLDYGTSVSKWSDPVSPISLFRSDTVGWTTTFNNRCGYPNWGNTGFYTNDGELTPTSTSGVALDAWVNDVNLIRDCYTQQRTGDHYLWANAVYYGNGPTRSSDYTGQLKFTEL